MRLTEELSEQRRNMKRMNKHNYHRRVKEAGSTQTIITINAPDPDQIILSSSWAEYRPARYHLVNIENISL